MVTALHVSKLPFNTFSVDVLVGSMAGVDFFETDYPLHLATIGKALLMKKPPQCDDNTLLESLVSDISLSDSAGNVFLSLAIVL